MPQTVIVTGANRGLGLEFVRQLASRGDHVIAAARRPSDAAEAGRLAPELVELDASDADSLERFAASLKGRPVDVLINNAGLMGDDKDISSVSMAEFERVFRVNAFAPAVLTRLLLPNLRAGSRKLVLNISSTLGSIAQCQGGFSHAYCSSKAALNMLTAAAARDLASDGITVVTFCPGWNRTDMGGANAPLDPAQSIASLLRVAEHLRPADSGRYLSHEGRTIPW